MSLLCLDLKRQWKDDEDLKAELIPKLAAKACHLPGYNWSEDFFQYQFNTHPILGMFLHHPFHPVTRLERLPIFVGTIAFGYLFTFLVWMAWPAEGGDQESAGDDEFAAAKGLFDSVMRAIEEGDLSLISLNSAAEVGAVYSRLFVVGVLQFVFAEILWKLQACSCYQPGGRCYSEDGTGSKYCPTFGNVLATSSVLCVVIFALIFTSEGCSSDECNLTDSNFWKGYLYQISVATGWGIAQKTIIFSGAIPFLFCDKPVCMKFLGGRRAELQKAAQRRNLEAELQGGEEDDEETTHPEKLEASPQDGEEDSSSDSDSSSTTSAMSRCSF